MSEFYYNQEDWCQIVSTPIEEPKKPFIVKQYPNTGEWNAKIVRVYEHKSFSECHVCKKYPNEKFVFTKNGNNFRKTCDSCYLSNKEKFKQDGWQYDYSCTLIDNNQNESKITISIKESLKDLAEGIGMVLGGALKEMSGDDLKRQFL